MKKDENNSPLSSQKNLDKRQGICYTDFEDSILCGAPIQGALPKKPNESLVRLPNRIEWERTRRKDGGAFLLLFLGGAPPLVSSKFAKRKESDS